MPRLRRKKRIKQNKDILRTSILRTVVVLVLIGLNWTGLSAVIETFAYFNDTESSNANNYQSGFLDFSLRSGQSNFVPLEKTLNMKPGDTVARDIYIKKEGSLAFKYTAVSEPVEDLCDLELYNALQLKIWYNWYDATPTEPNYHEYRHMDLKYDGLLKNFNLRALNPDDPDLQIPNTHPYFENNFYGEDEHWFYASQIILPAAVSAELQNKSCQFKFIFDGWQINLGDNSSGFTDTEEILSTIATGDWMPEVTVEYPNGGETWYLVPDSCPSLSWCSQWCVNHGMDANCQYPLRWTATNQIGPDIDLLIDIYFSTSSGTTWMAQIANDTENDGIYWWKIPYNMSYVTDRGRIKVEATHKDYSFLTDWDMSNADFCPPLLALEDLLNWEEPPGEEELTTEEEPVPEESIEEAVDEVVEEEPIVEETQITEEEAIVEEEPIEEEVITEENQEQGGIIEEINEEAPADETPVIEEQPANEEQPVTVPNNDSPQNEPADGNDNSGGSDGSSNDSTATSVDNGSSESAGDSENNLGE